jgi:predicted ArsR family transcriptional regulator
MSQEKIEKALKKFDKATAEEIAKLIHLSVHAVRMSLNRMERWNEVEKIKMEKKEMEIQGTKYSGRHYLWQIKK